MGEKSDKAQSYFDRITFGHRNAVKRPWDQQVDRSLRAKIERANHNGDCIVNTGNGEGYFRPIPGDPVDDKAYHKYRAKEKSRIKNEELKVASMDKTYEGWRDSAAYANHFREARQSERLHSSLSLKPVQGGETESKKRTESTG